MPPLCHPPMNMKITWNNAYEQCKLFKCILVLICSPPFFHNFMDNPLKLCNSIPQIIGSLIYYKYYLMHKYIKKCMKCFLLDFTIYFLKNDLNLHIQLLVSKHFFFAYHSANVIKKNWDILLYNSQVLRFRNTQFR